MWYITVCSVTLWKTSGSWGSVLDFVLLVWCNFTSFFYCGFEGNMPKMFTLYPTTEFYLTFPCYKYLIRKEELNSCNMRESQPMHKQKNPMSWSVVHAWKRAYMNEKISTLFPKLCVKVFHLSLVSGTAAIQSNGPTTHQNYFSFCLSRCWDLPFSK